MGAEFDCLAALHWLREPICEEIQRYHAGER